jgi:hypothetical protein
MSRRMEDNRISFLFFRVTDMEDIDKRAQVMSYCSVSD